MPLPAQLTHAAHAVAPLLEPLARWREDPDPWCTGPGVARHRPPHASVFAPFPAYLQQPIRQPAQQPVAHRSTPQNGSAAGVGAPPVPRFARLLGRECVRIPAETGTSYYGTGEVAGRLRRNGTTTTCWNTDAFAYDDRTPALYQSHPWVLAVRADGSSFGVLVESTHRLQIDLTAGITVRIQGPPAPVTIIHRDHPIEVVEELTRLTGLPPLPPRWALGYHQCRWSYENEERVRGIARAFRERQIPCDAIWFDIDYMDGFRCFTVDRDAFPDPKALNEDLHAQGYKTVWMIDAGIKVDPEYQVYAQGQDGDHFVRDAGGDVYHGIVWPGPCAFPDFTRSRTREWWAGLYEGFMDLGIDGVWNDMNEPAVFTEPSSVNFSSKTMPATNRHDADAELGGPGDHARYHNIYGWQMVRATREGVLRAKPEARPFVLTRSGFLGSQRHAATWTGDNVSDARHLRWSVPMALNLGLSGQAFAGPDIGGFDGDASPDLFARWMGIGCLLPFARAHSIKQSGDHEPWSFTPSAELACRVAIERRYRLLPYIYTLFRRAHTHGTPVALPLFVIDPADPALRNAEDSFLLGTDLLVRCELTPDDGCRAAMPPGEWRRIEITDQTHHATPDLYVRAGRILPLGPVMQHTGEKPTDPLTLLIAPDASGRAEGELYEDDDDGHAHEHGGFRLTRFVYEHGSDGPVVRAERVDGDRPEPDRTVVQTLVH